MTTGPATGPAAPDLRNSHRNEDEAGAPKSLIVSVTSGLCNRLWVLACALRLADRSGRQVRLLWLPRTGRVGLAYEGDEASSFEDFFNPEVEGLASTETVTDPPVLDEHAAGLDFSDIHDLTLALQAGRKPEITPALAAKATGPRILDMDEPALADSDDVWINLSTMPVGEPEDGMERFATYPSEPGAHRKDAFLESLSTYARKIQLKKADRQVVDDLVATMRNAPGGKRLVGIHVRATDLKQRTAIDRNVRIADMIHQLICTPGQGARVFLASDSNEWLADFIHTSLRPQARSAVMTYDNPDKFENSVAGTHAAIVDLYTLAACDTICGTAGSSFSSFAWLVSDAQFLIHS